MATTTAAITTSRPAGAATSPILTPPTRAPAITIPVTGSGCVSLLSRRWEAKRFEEAQHTRNKALAERQARIHSKRGGHRMVDERRGGREF